MDFPLTIESQDEFDKKIGPRLERARAELQAEIERLEAKLTEAQAEGYLRLLNRDVNAALRDANVAPERRERIMKLLDTGQIGKLENGDPDPRGIQRAIKRLHDDVPELFGGADPTEKGLDTSAARPAAPTDITGDDLLTMSEEDINRNWGTLSERLPSLFGGSR